MNKKNIAATLILVPLATYWMGHQALNADIPTVQKIQQHQDTIRELQEELHTEELIAEATETAPPAPEVTPTSTPAAPAPAPEATPVDIYEDGSATMSDGTTRPEGTYPWDCRTDGNQHCGVQIHGEWYILDFSTSDFFKRD